MHSSHHEPKVYNLSMIHYHIPQVDNPNYMSKDAGFLAIDHDLPIDELNVAEIHLGKRYPVEGFALNTKSKMIVKILDGEVIYHCEGESVFLSKGAVVYVETGKQYAWEPKPDVSLYIVSVPPWTPEQAETIV